MRKGRSSLRRLGAALTVAGLAGVAFSPGAGAEIDAGPSYTVLARADALAVEYLNTAAPVFAENAIVYATPATAQSLVDSVGQSTAYAAAPYPGEIMVGLPDNGKGVVSGLGGPHEVIPTYPFFVQSEHPIKPHAVQDQSGNRLVADSDQYSSSSDARSGLITGDLFAALQAQASSSAVVDSTTGKITATADSRLDALKITDALQIGKSTAHAQMVQEPGQPPVKESSFTIGSIVVGGVEMSYSDQGFKMGDQTTAPPGDPAPLFEALKGAGITVEILPATGSESSIESAGMKITQVQEFGGFTQRVSIILGRVRTAISGSATPADDSLLDPFPASGETSGPPVLVDEPTPTLNQADGFAAAPVAEFVEEFVAAAPLPAFDLGSSSFDSSAGAGLAAAPGPAVQAAPAPSGSVRLASPAAVGRGLRDDDYSGFYLALAAALAVVFLGSRLLGALGAGAAAGGSTSVLKLPQ
ncbi:MAG: hypothetical protein ACRD0O_16675 [Acidimicrobiia bacterium]